MSQLLEPQFEEERQQVFEGKKKPENEAFYMRELEELRDAKRRVRGTRVLQKAMIDLNLASEAQQLEEILSKAEKKLYRMYNWSRHFEADFFRLRHQLYRYYAERIKVLAPVIIPKVELAEFAVDEKREVESLAQPDLLTSDARDVFKKGKTRLLQLAEEGNLDAVWNKGLEIRANLNFLYKAPTSVKENLSKWLFMLDKLVYGLIQKGKAGGEMIDSEDTDLQN